MRPRGMRGAALVELLVALALLGFVALGLVAALRVVARAGLALTARSEAEAAARTAVQLIAQDLRGAGFAPDGPLVPVLAAARRDGVAVVRDLNGDGDLNDPNERIAYTADRAGRLLRRLGAAPAQPMVDGLAPNGLQFEYRDASGRLLDPGPDGLPGAVRATVRRVDIRVSVRIQVPGPAGGGDPVRAVTHRSSVALRNG